MEKDLKWIKKHYGEKMMHLCRDSFSRILEVEGLLPQILANHFQQNRNLAQDIIDQNAIIRFKNYIFSFVDVETETPYLVEEKSAIELLDEAGYILFPECQSEEDIQKFRKFYSKGEEICTFWTDRSNTCRVWFAIKKNVNEIRREDFKKPSRQDEYGTSVISIQFTKSDSTLSIKNRYNHNVNNPDNTFNSNLNNIIEGLAEAFYRDYGVKDNLKRDNNFELDNYVFVQGKHYKYNNEINNIYYCTNNVIIDNFEVKKLPESQMLVDYFIFDFKNNTISCYDSKITDSFVDSIGKIETMFFKDNVITIKVKDGEDILVKINDNREIISVTNPNLIKSDDKFLYLNKTIKELNMPNLRQCGDSFLYHNKDLIDLNLPKLTQCGNYFLYHNISLENLNLPNLARCGGYFLYQNNSITEFNMPNLVEIGTYFFHQNNVIKELNLPSLINCDNIFFYHNDSIEKVNMPNLRFCGSYFLTSNNSIKKLNLPNLRQCGETFLSHNTILSELHLPNLVECGNYFLRENNSLIELELPNLVKCGDKFLYENESLKRLITPKLVQFGNGFLYFNSFIDKSNLQNVNTRGRRN